MRGEEGLAHFLPCLPLLLLTTFLAFSFPPTEERLLGCKDKSGRASVPPVREAREPLLQLTFGRWSWPCPLGQPCPLTLVSQAKGEQTRRCLSVGKTGSNGDLTVLLLFKCSQFLYLKEPGLHISLLPPAENKLLGFCLTMLLGG